MIKFCDPNAIERVIIDDTAFQFRRVSVRTKFEMLTALSSLNKETPIETLDNLKEVLGRIIVSISIGDAILDFNDAFERIATFDSVKKIITGVLDYCGLTEAQRKNSDSSPEQPSPVLAGNAENSAEPDGAPAGTIPA